MTPHETGSTATPGTPRATAPLTRTFGPQGPTLGDLSDAYLQDYQVRQFRSHSTARGRVAHLTAFFGRAARAGALTTHQIRQYQLARRAAGAATGTINRETSALHRMGTLAVHWGWLDTVPGFPDRLRENPPRQGFFEHPEYLAVRAHLPAPWQDILDVAYYSGWRKQEILGLTWEEIDEAGGVIRLSPARSKTLVGRILPISQPIAEALARRRARRDPVSPLVFHRDGIPVRRWRTAWRTACQAAGVPTRFLHDCRRTAARNLIRASVPERVAMLLTGHKSRAIFDRYNIIHEQELLDAGDQLVAYLAQQVPARRGRQWPDTARLCAAARARATGTNRPAIVAHAARGLADAAEHEHPPGQAAGVYRKAGCHLPAQGHTRQRSHARRASRQGRGWGSRDWPMFPRLAASLLPLVYSLFVRYGAQVRKPTFPEQLYIDFDGFFAACEEQADRQLQGRPLGVIPFAGAVNSCVIAANTLAKRVGVTTGMAIADARRRCPGMGGTGRTEGLRFREGGRGI